MPQRTPLREIGQIVNLARRYSINSSIQDEIHFAHHTLCLCESGVYTIYIIYEGANLAALPICTYMNY